MSGDTEQYDKYALSYNRITNALTLEQYYNGPRLSPPHAHEPISHPTSGVVYKLAAVLLVSPIMLLQTLMPSPEN
jgi:hypothetical protein